MNYEQRIRNAQEKMKEQGIDYLILTPSTDLLYLTGYRGMLSERLTCLILTQEEPYFVLPQFEMDTLYTKLSLKVSCIPWEETESPYEKIKRFLTDDEKKAAVGAYTPGMVMYRFQKNFSKWEWTLANDILDDMRMIKSAEEESCIKESHKRCEKALYRLYEHGLQGMTEAEAMDLLETYCKQEGLNILNGFNMVATGPDGALQHYDSQAVKIKRGDPVIIDFGYEYAGYISDITRTPIVGYASEEVKEVYQIVREANEAAAKAVQIGVTCENIDRAARRVIEKAGYGQYFTHRLGHGIGLDMHEEPYMVEGNKRILQDGYTFSDEPGIYLPGKFGIRIEDILIARPDGAHKLNDLPHEMVIVD